ncbi:hypothetical protein FN976_09190 [Caenimonas sedimenti]|uniref:Uncharacterized protein n=1 Tax=Caenimonas sedimenti TaxID=2596921 RepID=A0A562ZTF7_9BURK|nr:hypothetical protein [Caenimonas sedimenti]TWO71773.1 hypothetical protein FN976_09190 [Caenimonas sedimenti]
MHTVICAFDDAAQARQSVDRLVELGVRRGDIHIEHKGLHASSALANFGAFFVSLLGQEQSAAVADRYTGAVQGGQHVLVLDALDEEQAGRASALLAAMGGQGPRTVHRPLLRPLRDIVAVRAVLADHAGRRDAPGDERPMIRAEQNERAFAFGGEQRPQNRPDPDDAGHAPGLRYADQDSKDKPRR